LISSLSLTSWGPYTAAITLVLPISNKADLTATNQGLAQPKSGWSDYNLLWRIQTHYPIDQTLAVQEHCQSTHYQIDQTLAVQEHWQRHSLPNWPNPSSTRTLPEHSLPNWPWPKEKKDNNNVAKPKRTEWKHISSENLMKKTGSKRLLENNQPVCFGNHAHLRM
jgi:hypothetical protein